MVVALLGSGGNVDNGVVLALCGVAGVMPAPEDVTVVPLPVFGLGALKGVAIVGFTVKEFSELKGTPGVAAIGVNVLGAGKGGAGISVFHSLIVYKVASSMCGSMII